jgi:hypothetical protein
MYGAVVHEIVEYCVIICEKRIWIYNTTASLNKGPTGTKNIYRKLRTGSGNYSPSRG